MTFDRLAYELTDDGVGRITFNRADRRNALDLQQAQELEEVTATIAHDPRVRAVLIDSEGPAFHVGGDLKHMAGKAEGGASAMGTELRRMTAAAHSAIEHLARLDAPVIVAVHGAAAGGGMSMALCGDLVLAGESASFTMAYTAAALSPDMSATWFLPRVVGLRRAQELIYTNRRLSAAEALAWGIVTEVVPDDELAERAGALARQVAQGPTRSYGASKRLLASTFGQGLEAQMADEAQAISELTATDDTRHGVQSFVAKQTPTYRGQ